MPYDEVLQTIQEEMNRIENRNTNALQSFPKKEYLYWFLPKQLLLTNMPASVRTYKERIAQDIQQFRSINFTNPNFKTSGLFKQLIESHYLLLENMGQSLDSIYVQMNITTDYIIENIHQEKWLLNMVSAELFTLFEKRGLTAVASHLSNLLIANHLSILNDDLHAKMERYVTLKVGNKSPDISLNATTKLSTINNNVLLVFGKSQCGHCQNEKKELLNYHAKWKEQGTIEIVYISLDENKEDFLNAHGQMPWQSYCDYKGLKTQAAKDYFINATPTYVLIDKEMKILVHPRSLAQVDAWMKMKKLK